jgi:hypothetical protein
MSRAPRELRSIRFCSMSAVPCVDGAQLRHGRDASDGGGIYRAMALCSGELVGWGFDQELA